MIAIVPAQLSTGAQEAIRWNFSAAAVHLTVAEAREHIRQTWGDNVHHELEKFFLPIKTPSHD